MEYNLNEIKPAGLLESIEKRTVQLWILATILICFLGGTLVLIDISSMMSIQERILGISRGFYRSAILLCIPLISIYLWEKVRELQQSNGKLITSLERYVKFLEHRNKELGALNALSEKLKGSMDLEEGLQMVLETATMAIRANRGSIYIFDPDSGELSVKARTGYLDESEPASRSQIGSSPLGWVAVNRQPILINCSRPGWRSGEMTGVIPSMMVPLCENGKSFGVLLVEERSTGGEFTQSDLEMLTAFAAQGVWCLNNLCYAPILCHSEGKSGQSPTPIR